MDTNEYNLLKVLKKLRTPAAALCVLASNATFAQIDLKDLRAKPDTIFAEKLSPPVDNLAEIPIPIPKMDLRVNYWKHWSKFGINGNQASFSENWSAGGVNSIALLGTVWHKSEYNRNSFNFTTETDLKYGKIHNKNQLAKKNNDRIFWDNKLAYNFFKDWAVYFSLTFESQFDIGYNYRKIDGEEVIYDVQTAFMGPGSFTESLGVEYKPNKAFSLRLGTGTARQTLMVNDRSRPLTVAEYAERYPDNAPIGKDQTKFGIEAGQRIKKDLAFQITANLDRNLAENLNLKARYNLFADYQDVKKPDHRLDLVLTARVTKMINVSMNGIVLYDNDWIVEPATKAKIQYSQALAMGLTFNLPVK